MLMILIDLVWNWKFVFVAPEFVLQSQKDQCLVYFVKQFPLLQTVALG